MRNAGGEIIGIVGISRDVTDRKRAEAQIQYMAHHDALTGLANRFVLMERLSHAIVKARQEGLRFVLFKPFRVDQLLEALENNSSDNRTTAGVVFERSLSKLS